MGQRISSNLFFLLYVLLNFPLLKFWEPVSIHNIYNVPLGAGASSGGPEGRSCEWHELFLLGLLLKLVRNFQPKVTFIIYYLLFKLFQK